MNRYVKRIVSNQTVINSGWLIMGKVVQLAISFFISIFIARYLGPHKYGILNLAMAYTSFFLPLCSLGISNVIVKEFIDHPDAEGEILGSAIGARIITSLISIIGIVVLLEITNSSNIELQVSSFIYSMILAVRSFELIEYWYQSKLKSKITAIIGIIAYIITALFRTIILILHCSVYLFVFAYVLDAMITSLLYVYSYNRDKNSKISFRFNTVRQLIKKSYHYILSSMMVMIYAQMDKIMIGKMEDENSVGVYAVAVAICQLWTFILQAIIDSVRPSIINAKKYDSNLYENRIIQLYSIIIWISICVSLCFCIFAHYIILILYGRDYVNAEIPLRIITWYTCFSYLGVARNIWSVCENMQKYEKYFALAGAIANTILNLVLIPIYGISGAAVASLITQIITNLVVPYCINNTRVNAIYVIKAFDIRYIIRIIRSL